MTFWILWSSIALRSSAVLLSSALKELKPPVLWRDLCFFRGVCFCRGICRTRRAVSNKTALGAVAWAARFASCAVAWFCAGAWSACGRPRAPPRLRRRGGPNGLLGLSATRRLVRGGRALARADRRSGEPGARRLLGYFCEGLGGQHRAPSTLFASRDLSQAAWTSQSCIGAPPEAPQWAPSSSLSRPPCSRRRQTSGPWAVAARSRPTTLLIIRKSRRSERRRSRAAPAPVDAPAPVEPPSEAGRDAVGLTRGRVATPPRPLHGSSVDGSRDRPSTGRAWIGLALGTRVP